MPASCPVCGGNVVREPGESVTKCINVSCPARLKEALLHFASRSVMNIDGMGEALIDQLVDGGLVQSIADIYDLTLESLLNLDRMGRRSATAVIRNIAASKSAPLPRVLAALGIRFVGDRTARILAQHFGSLDKISTSSAEQLQKAGEVGPKVAESIVDYFSEPRNVELLDRLRAANLNLEYKVERSAKSPLEGLTFVITGRLSNDRAEVANLIESAGGQSKCRHQPENGFPGFGRRGRL